jgi:signal transduction histidine kinase
MTKEQITQIGAFQQFERQTYAQQGLGLGLKIVKKIIELYGGELNISSVYQQATQIDNALLSEWGRLVLETKSEIFLG